MTELTHLGTQITREASRQDDLRDSESKRWDDLFSILREHLEQLRVADKEAINIAREAVDRRLGEMNNMREQINQERGTFVRMDWYESKHKEIESRVSKLEEWQWKVIGGMAVSLTVGTVLGWIINTLMQGKL